MSEVVSELLGVATPTLKQLAEEAGVSYTAARYLAKGSPYEIRDSTLNPLIEKIEERQRQIDALLKQLRRSRAVGA